MSGNGPLERRETVLTAERYEIVRQQLVAEQEALLQAVRYLQASCERAEQRDELRMAWRAGMQTVRRLRNSK